ncbi:MAG: hypothetical protein V4659_05040 [Pseudomonadota bacterium]
MIRPILFASLVLAGPALAAGPLSVTTAILVEARSAAPDGSTRVTLVSAARAVPGDRVIVRVAYRNTGPAPIAGLVIANPVPPGLVYRGPAPGSPAAELSADGSRFGPLARLTVAGRAAAPADITHVRWRLASPVAPGSGGQFAFQAVLK